MSLIGYARVSTAEDRQVLDLQLDALNEAGCERVFEDRASEGCLGPRCSSPDLSVSTRRNSMPKERWCLFDPALPHAASASRRPHRGTIRNPGDYLPSQVRPRRPCSEMACEGGRFQRSRILSRAGGSLHALAVYGQTSGVR